MQMTVYPGGIMKALSLAAIILFSTAALADNYRQGYMRKDGVYVQPSYQSAPNNTRLDNYSTQGNINPYTGQAGTRDPYQSQQPRPSNYENRPDSRKSRTW
jgi:hypothetical protein